MKAPIPASLGIRIRTFAVLSVVLNLPVLARLTRGLTREPRVENIEIDGTPVSILRPAGRGPWPAILFLNGAHPLRRREPLVERVAEGFARAGYLVVVPDLPGLGLGELTMRTVDAAAAITRAVTELADVRSGRIALIGASTGSGIALVLAARADLAGRISLVSSVVPYADLRRMICLATTAHYEQAGSFRSYGVTNLLRRVVARSLLVMLPCGEERERLLERVGDILEDDDPFERLPASGDCVSAEARATIRVLENRDCTRFPLLFDELSAESRKVVAQLSPLSVAREVHAPVELAVPPIDRYFPIDEAEMLARALPNVRLTVTSALDHTRPEASLTRLGDFWTFNCFVVRTMAGAASGCP